MGTERISRAMLSGLLVVSLLVYAVLPLLGLTSPTTSSSATIWTENAEGYPQTDFEPDENVYIRGSGFSPDSWVEITIVRPDNSEDLNQTLSGGDGCFLYIYSLDGIYGTYLVTASDGTNYASTTFTDCPKLQGLDGTTMAWTSGKLTGWRELDWVPYRIVFKYLPRGTSTFAFNVYHNNLRAGKLGVDALADFYVGYENGEPAGDGTVAVSGPYYKAPGKECDRDIYYALTVTFNLASSRLTRCVYWKAHVALGASGWPGASLHAYTDITGSQDVPIDVPPTPTGSVSGHKWNDLDRDGTWDGDELGLEGWTVRLFRWDPESRDWVHLMDKVTNADGGYVFTNLTAGEYRVEEVSREGWTQTYPPTGAHEITLPEGGNVTGIDFGNFFASLGVNVSISPRERSGLPGDTLTYEICVTNTGTLADEYDLSAGDALGWGLSLLPSSLSLDPGETGVAMLSVTIPAEAAPGTVDEVTVVATSRADPTVSDGDACIASVAIVRAVEVSISPSYQSGPPGSNLTFTVVVRNLGNVVDSYTLIAWDNENWLGPWSQELLDLTPGASAEKPLDVSIPNIAIPCTEDNIIVRATSQTDPDVSAENSAIAHVAAFRRAVAVSLAPNYQEALPGGTVDFAVVIRNEGDVEDNIVLNATDNENWGAMVYPESIILPPGSSGNATLSLSIPKSARARGDKKVEVSVTASSAENTEVSSSDNGIVKILTVRGVDVSISPNYQAGVAGSRLVYTVTVTNTGNVDDNYYLNVSDNENWPIAYWFTFISLPAYSSAQSELIVTIPENATPCTRDNIVVTVASWDNAVSDSDSCIAHRGKAELSFVTLYKVLADVDFYFVEGSKLVVKFYTYLGVYQAEIVIWSGTTPAQVVLTEDVAHPEGKGVENATLVLTDDAGNVLSVLASFVVRRPHLLARLSAIKAGWPYASPEEKSALLLEISAIKARWPYAPE